MEVAQLGRIETKAGVLGNVAPGTKRLALAFDQHAAQLGRAGQRLEDAAQLQPHGARHGVEPPFMAQQHPHHPCTTFWLLCALPRGDDDFTCHAVFLHPFLP